jgi:hypothetical protein
MSRMSLRAVVYLCLLLSCARSATAQSDAYRFQAGVQLPVVVSGEFEGTDIGVGGRVSWHPAPLFGIEGELSVYPGELADEPAFSGGRLEGLFGATIGPRMGRLRPFAKFRPGFVTYREASEPVPCILIFPPPLHCALAAGDTLFALDIGGGVEWYPSDRTFVRVEAGDRAIRYPSPVIDSDGTVQDEAFFGHDFRLAFGGGLRF